MTPEAAVWGGLSLAHAMQVVPVHAGLLIAVHRILRCLPLRRPYPAGCAHRQCGLCLPPQQHARAPSAAPAATVRGANLHAATAYADEPLQTPIATCGCEGLLP